MLLFTNYHRVMCVDSLARAGPGPAGSCEFRVDRELILFFVSCVFHSCCSRSQALVSRSACAHVFVHGLSHRAPQRVQRGHILIHGFTQGDEIRVSLMLM